MEGGERGREFGMGELGRGKEGGKGGGGLLPDVYFKGMEFLWGRFWVCKWGPNEAVN